MAAQSTFWNCPWAVMANHWRCQYFRAIHRQQQGIPRSGSVQTRRTGHGGWRRRRIGKRTGAKQQIQLSGGDIKQTHLWTVEQGITTRATMTIPMGIGTDMIQAGIGGVGTRPGGWGWGWQGHGRDWDGGWHYQNQAGHWREAPQAAIGAGPIIIKAERMRTEGEVIGDIRPGPITVAMGTGDIDVNIIWR